MLSDKADCLFLQKVWFHRETVEGISSVKVFVEVGTVRGLRLYLHISLVLLKLR